MNSSDNTDQNTTTSDHDFDDFFPTRDRSNLRSIDGQLWVRASAELSMDDKIEIALEPQASESTAEQRARWGRHRVALEARRQFHRDAHKDDDRVAVAEGIDVLEDAFNDLVRLQAEVEALLDRTFVHIEDAINGLHRVAPRAHKYAFAGGEWLSSRWNDWPVAAPLITKAKIHRRTETRREELQQAVEERDIAWADRQQQHERQATPDDASNRDEATDSDGTPRTEGGQR